MEIKDINTSEGNYTGYSNGKFPLDADGMQSVQEARRLLAALGNIGGENYILSGVEYDTTSGKYSAGYVYIHTLAAPQGELLYAADGSADTLAVSTTYDTIKQSDMTYSNAYAHRHLEHGMPVSPDTEQISISKLDRLTTNTALDKRLAAIEDSIKGIVPESIGTIKIWPGDSTPENWLRCDGSSYKTSDYPILSSLLGQNFSDGKSGSTDSFYLPDLQGRVPMGCNKADKDDLWSVLGHSGGERYHQLTMDEMPRHKHAGDPNLSFHVGLAGKGEALQGTEDNAVRALGQGPKYGNTADYDIAVKFDTLQQVRQAQEVYRGGDNAHNNIQPSLAVNFIIKAK